VTRLRSNFLHLYRLYSGDADDGHVEEGAVNSDADVDDVSDDDDADTADDDDGCMIIIIVHPSKH